MDRFIPNVPGCSKYHISKDGELYSIFSGTRKVVKPVIRSNGIIPDRYGKKAKDSTSIPD